MVYDPYFFHNKKAVPFCVSLYRLVGGHRRVLTDEEYQKCK